MTYTIKAYSPERGMILESQSVTDSYTMAAHIADKYERMGYQVTIKEEK